MPNPAKSKAPDRAGRLLVWFPIFMFSLSAAVWSAERWPVPMSDDIYCWVFIPACTLVFLIVPLTEGIKKFRELRAAGALLITAGLIIMSLHGLVPAVGFTMDERLWGVSFYADLLGLFWLAIYSAAIGGATAWLHVCKGERH